MRHTLYPAIEGKTLCDQGNANVTFQLAHGHVSMESLSHTIPNIGAVDFVHVIKIVK